MKPTSQIQNDLKQFTGTEPWHSHLLGVLLTYGTKQPAEKTGPN